MDDDLPRPYEIGVKRSIWGRFLERFERAKKHDQQAPKPAPKRGLREAFFTNFIWSAKSLANWGDGEDLYGRAQVRGNTPLTWAFVPHKPFLFDIR